MAGTETGASAGVATGAAAKAQAKAGHMNMELSSSETAIVCIARFQTTHARRWRR